MKKLLLIITSFFLFLGVGAQTSVWDGSASAWSKGDGTKDNPFLIESAAHLAYLSQQTAMSQTYDGHYFRLETDIDLNNRAWIPVGGRNMQGNESGYPFRGVFDGNNKTVSNLSVNFPNQKCIGLFGSLYGATIKNLNISGNISYIGKEYFGAIAGDIDQCQIINCSNQSNIIVNDGGFIGGIVGRANDSFFWKCSNNGNISGTSRIAGIVGDAGDCIINDCNNKGQISAEHTTGGIGGYVGDITFINCYNNGSVEATTTNGGCGGIAGSIYQSSSSLCTITNCYNTGTLTGIKDVGGIVGEVSYSISLNNSYNMGIITANNNFGAIIGKIGTNTDVSNCYYLNTCIAKNNDYGISQTSENMKTQLFVNTLNASQDVTPWKIDNSQNDSYPVLIVSPYVKTLAATNITDRLALLNGIVLKGEEEIVSQGFRFKKYGTSSYSTEIVNGNNISSSIICESASGYIFQAFATTASGTYYGDEQTFVTTGTAGIENVDQSKSAVYPNPSSTYIHIPYRYGNEESVLYIYDNSGKQVDIKILNVSDTEMTIDVSSLKKGVYFYKLNNASGKFVVN